MANIIINNSNQINVDISTPRGIKVNVGASQKIRSVPLQETNRSIVAPGEQKPIITPDSVALGIDTVGNYVETLDVGDGLVLSGNNATESATLILSHALTSNEVSSSNDFLGVLGNVSIDQFGHVTELDSQQLNADNFTANSTTISSKDFFIGDTGLTLGDSVSNVEGLDFVETESIATNLILSSDDLIITSNVVDVNGNGALIVPVGDTSERPSPFRQGMIRYNTDLIRYESYLGSDWSVLGGVIDANQDTFIRAENPNGANNDELEFFTNGIKRMMIGSNGDVTIGPNDSFVNLYYNRSEVNVNGFLTIDEIKIDNNEISANNDLHLTANGDINFSTTNDFNFASNGFNVVADGEIVLDSTSDIVSVSNSRITNVLNPQSAKDAVNLDYLENEFGFEIDVEYGANTKQLSISSGTTPVISAGRGIGADVENNTLTLSITDTGVTPGIYGTDGFTPRITLDTDGRVTFATEIPIELQANAITDFTETLYDLVGEMFRDNIEEGIDVFDDDNTDKINLRVDNFSIDLEGDISGNATVFRASNTVINTEITVDYVADIVGGLGIDVDLTQGTAASAIISHSDTSDVANTSNASGVVVSNANFDDFGHVVEIESQDLNQLFLSLGGGTLTDDIKAPRFVDSDNDIFYVDPAGQSRLNGITLGFNSNTARLEMKDGINSSSILISQLGRIGFLGSDFNYASYSERATNNWVVRNDVQAASFVDRNDTSFFVHPGGKDSRILGLNVVNNILVGADMDISATTISASTIILDSDDDIINASDSRITNVLSPTQDLDATNKIYVDTKIADGFNDLVGGEGLTYDSNTSTFDVNVDGSSIQIVNDVLEVNSGANSGFDADLLDGEEGDFYLDYDNFENTPEPLDANDILDLIVTVDGANSNLDADLLDGEEGEFYLDYNNFENVPPAQSTDFDIVLSGKVTGSGQSFENEVTVITELANTGVVSGIYGSASQVPIITIDEDGRITNAGVVSVAGVSNTTWDPASTTFTIETADGGEFETIINDFGSDVTFTNINLSGLVDGRDVASDGIKLDNIEDNATADQTASEILSSLLTVDGPNSDLNADLLDSQHGVYYLNYNNFNNTPTAQDLLDDIKTVDGTGSGLDSDFLDGNNSTFFLDYDNFTNKPTPTDLLSDIITVDGANSGLDSDLLDGEDGLFYLDYNNFSNTPTQDSERTPEELLAAIITVDGANSGLDSDLLDGEDSSYYLNYDNFTNTPGQNQNSDTPSQILAKLITVDGSGSGLDADLLDGENGSYYLDYENFDNTPTAADLLADIITVDGSGSGLDADLLDGQEGSYYTDYTDNVANSINDATITVSAGDGLDGGGAFTLNQSANATITVAHADTSNVTDVSTSGKNVISAISFDEFGHTISRTTRTLDFVTPAEADTDYVNVTGDTMTGNLEVQGVISQNESAFGSDSFSAGTVLEIDLFSFSAAVYGSAEIIITSRQGINKHITKLLIVHNGTDASATEFGTVYTNESLGDYDVRIESGNVIVSVTAANGTTINYKIISTLISN